MDHVSVLEGMGMFRWLCFQGSNCSKTKCLWARGVHVDKCVQTGVDMRHHVAYKHITHLSTGTCQVRQAQAGSSTQSGAVLKLTS